MSRAIDRADDRADDKAEDREAEEAITAFRGEFAFLSNFFPHPVTVEDETYPTAEHAFQALKTRDPAERARVRAAATPAQARRLGKRVTLRDGWSGQHRFTAMEQVLRAKFADPDLARRLSATGERELIEGNTWRDTTWGCIPSKNGGWTGRNELGKLLMRLRAEIRRAGASDRDGDSGGDRDSDERSLP